MMLSGVIAPICTPFQENGEVHHDALRKNIAKYKRAELAGFVVAGTTGEAPLLNRVEKLRLFQTVREAAEGKVLIAGTGAESIRETLALTQDAADLGYDVALVLTPHYYRAQMSRPETQIAFFRAVADSSPIPILIYNLPQMTGIDLSLDAVVELSEHTNILGIKDSSADMERIEKLISALPTTFDVMVGASTKFHESLCLGAKGGIVAIANVAPHLTQLIYERYHSGDIFGSHQCQQQIAHAAGVAARYGIQGLKYAMDTKGYFGGACRMPLLPLGKQQKDEIDLLFHDIEDNEL